MRKRALLAAVATLAAMPALAQTQQQRTRAAQDQTDEGQPSSTPDSTTGRAAALTTEEFARAVAMSDRYELAASRLATQRSTHADIRGFAERLIRDHQRSSAQFQRLLADVPGRAGATTTTRGGGSTGFPQSAGRARFCNSPHTLGLPKSPRVLLCKTNLQDLGVIAATTSLLLIAVRLSPCFTRGSC